MNLREPTSDTRGFVDAVLSTPDPRPAASSRQETQTDTRDRVIYWRHCDGQSVRHLSAAYGISERRVARIILEQSRRMRSA